MFYEQKSWIGLSEDARLSILPKMANRHGLIAGATGSGKTVTLKVMAEAFSDCGVPVFMADVKGDLAGMCQPGIETEDMISRKQFFGLTDDLFPYRSYPTCFWDIYGKTGIPLRVTISEMGPMLLARLMDLNPTQTDILRVVFKIADDAGLLLIDIKDLRAMLQHVYENSKEYSGVYGNLAKQSISAIMRAVVALEDAGGDVFFGEPALNILDWISADISGRGMIHILDAKSLINEPTMYSTFLLWMLSELFEVLPEVGDLEKPRMVFFFDEAHLLFQDTPKALLQKIEQVVKLIRSKGVGVYFITQNPSDIPDSVLAQLGNRVQHALHAYTPAEQRKVKAAADSFRTDGQFDALEVIMGLGTGEALVSFLEEDGTPAVAKKARILPPQSKMGSIDEDTRQRVVQQSLLYVRYVNPVDPESAYERLEAQREAAQRAVEEEAEAKAAAKEAEIAARQAAKEAEAAAKRAEMEKKKQQAAIGRVAKTATGTIGREIGKDLGKKVGGSFGQRLGGNMGSALGRGLLDTLFKR
ncbi:MAG: DUF853 family protein [Eubacteriales bacterium]|nr:DUF853 family protein [Eubacteriales bacterium]